MIKVALLLLLGAGAFCYVAGGRLRAIVEGAMRGALLVGGAGLALGFIGAGIFIPESNLGPLVGFIYTGPAGFLLGLCWGAWRAARGERE